ncbi:MAG: hypothetical protein AAF411_07115 [Myxococcota bacterium]
MSKKKPKAAANARHQTHPLRSPLQAALVFLIVGVLLGWLRWSRLREVEAEFHLLSGFDIAGMVTDVYEDELDNVLFRAELSDNAYARFVARADASDAAIFVHPDHETVLEDRSSFLDAPELPSPRNGRLLVHGCGPKGTWRGLILPSERVLWMNLLSSAGDTLPSCAIAIRKQCEQRPLEPEFGDPTEVRWLRSPDTDRAFQCPE